MKPRIFIGSSNEQRGLASALAGAMQEMALGSPWRGDVFKLGQVPVADLEKEAAESDFAVFVFAADDVAKIRGTDKNVIRDNVIFELGLFIGHLGRERCYGLVAMGQKVHLPSDLWGVTLGVYNPEHGEGRLTAAVLPFVQNELNERIKTLSFRHKVGNRRLYDLIVKYSCCDEYLHNNTGVRLEEKRKIWDAMLRACEAMPANKKTLLDEQHYVAFAAAIVSNPESEDYNLIQRVRPDLLKRGDPQARIVDAIIALRRPTKLISNDQRDKLVGFTETFQNPDPSLRQLVQAFQNT